jgi:hypothetical protein
LLQESAFLDLKEEDADEGNGAGDQYRKGKNDFGSNTRAKIPSHLTLHHRER